MSPSIKEAKKRGVRFGVKQVIIYVNVCLYLFIRASLITEKDRKGPKRTEKDRKGPKRTEMDTEKGP